MENFWRFVSSFTGANMDGISSLKIIFYGTPDFAVATLERLVGEGTDIAAVVTAPDKPAGRGQKVTLSPVKEFALQHQLKVLQPSNLKEESFVSEIKSINPDLQIVVAFRMLPEVVWNLPGLGTFNLHASLLPQYRGAAPINWAIINGEKETGVTTFFLRHEIDTGKIILQEKVPISDSDTAGTLHDKLMHKGAELVVRTLQGIAGKNVHAIEQQGLIHGELKAAPKLTRQNTKIDFNRTPEEIFNFVRGLNPVPSAHAELYSESGFFTLMMKIFSVIVENTSHENEIGSIESDQKSYLKVFVNGGAIYITVLQVEGRNRMGIKDFLNGFKLEGKWKMQ